MAVKTNTTTKKVEDTTVVEKKVAPTPKVDKEKEELKEQLKAMQEMMSTMQAQMNSTQNQPVNVQISQNQDSYRSVRVTSLVPYMLNLKTQSIGKKDGNRIYTFTKYGESKAIPFLDLQKIISIQESFFEDGRVILQNKEDYDALLIGNVYSNIISKEKIDAISELKSNEDIDIILSFSGDMQEAIARIIADKMNSGVSYDFNKIRLLKDNGLDIEEISIMSKNEEEK